MLTSAELRKNQAEYSAFVVHPETQEAMSIMEFCNQFVDGMGREAGTFTHFT
jgi:ubiquitin thioesterase protein OTUB1